MPDSNLPSGPAVSSELLVADTDTHTAELCWRIAAPLNVAESGLVDVVLLSENLPGAQGLELLRHIHYWYPETQVIVLAESPAFSVAVQATKVGAFDYLPNHWTARLCSLQSSAPWNTSGLKRVDEFPPASQSTAKRRMESSAKPHPW